MYYASYIVLYARNIRANKMLYIYRVYRLVISFIKNIYAVTWVPII